MNVVVDMNLPKTWIDVLKNAGHDARHWSEIGSPSAPDFEILEWARNNDFIIFTHDLDFGSILATMKLRLPSTIQIRALDITPAAQATRLLSALAGYERELRAGALITIDHKGARVRLLN